MAIVRVVPYEEIEFTLESGDSISFEVDTDTSTATVSVSGPNIEVSLGDLRDIVEFVERKYAVGLSGTRQGW